MKRIQAVGVAGLLVLALVSTGYADVITVTTGADPIDIDWQTATIADLPGPDGKVSFSEAMIASNNTPGHDTVEFAIPESEWQMQWLLPGYAVIYSSYTYFWRANDSVTIDGATQEAFTGDRNPGDAELVFYGTTIYLNADNSTFKGVHSGSVQISGSNSVAIDNTGGIHITLFGGSGSEVRNNVAGTIKIDRSSSNIVTGNVCNRVRVWGTAASGLPGDSNVIGGPTLADRNYITGYGSYNSEGMPAGHAIQLAGVSNTTIENNWIGTSVDGLSQGNLACTIGIVFEGENFNTVVRDNRIAGILGHGQGPHHAGQLFGWAIMMSGAGSGVTLSGNTIGLDANDQPVLGSVTGLDIGTWAYSGITDIEISDNVIAGHIFNGVSVGRDVAQARITRNPIYANGDLGIDLVPTGFGYGVSPNDPLDTDTGGNGLQNFPLLASAASDGVNLSVVGTLQGSPDSDFTIEFFASSVCDPSGFGQGEVYLGAGVVTTDASGDASFDIALPIDVPVGNVVTATATLEPLGATSEFSACVTVDAVETITGAGDTPSRFRLFDAYPNPFNPSTTLGFELDEPGSVRLDIFDVAGRRVRTLVNGRRNAGRHDETWDGRNDAGASVTSGVYFYRLTTPRANDMRKMVLLK